MAERIHLSLPRAPGQEQRSVHVGSRGFYCDGCREKFLGEERDPAAVRDAAISHASPCPAVVRANNIGDADAR